MYKCFTLIVTITLFSCTLAMKTSIPQPKSPTDTPDLSKNIVLWEIVCKGKSFFARITKEQAKKLIQSKTASIPKESDL